MSGRHRTVALQAIGVALLAAFVFVAFLRPSEPGELSGIEAPGGSDDGGATSADPPDTRKDGRDEGKGKGKDGDKSRTGKDGDRRGHSNGSSARGAGRGNSGALGGSIALGVAGGDLVFAPPTGASESPDEDLVITSLAGGEGPDDDQYTDLVSALMWKVGQPPLFREIDNP